MKATQHLHELGQSLWLDNITRDLLTKGTLKSYVAELSVPCGRQRQRFHRWVPPLAARPV
jgi:hypothetical protein